MINRILVFPLGALLACGAVAACDLNPQPLPPGDQGSTADASASAPAGGGSASSGGGSNTGTSSGTDAGAHGSSDGGALLGPEDAGVLLDAEPPVADAATDGALAVADGAPNDAAPDASDSD